MKPRVSAKMHLVPSQTGQREIVLSFRGSDCLPDLTLSAAEAAVLMFEIGSALEDADRFSDPVTFDTKLSLKFPRRKTEI